MTAFLFSCQRIRFAVTMELGRSGRRVNRVRCPLARARGGHADSATSVSRPTRAKWLSRLGGAAALGDVANSF